MTWGYSKKRQGDRKISNSDPSNRYVNPSPKNKPQKTVYYLGATMFLF
jgi:hypothetical protein